MFIFFLSSDFFSIKNISSTLFLAIKYFITYEWESICENVLKPYKTNYDNKKKYSIPDIKWKIYKKDI